MWWVLVPMFACAIGLLVMALRARRDQRILAHINALLGAGHHQRVLDHSLPTRPLLDLARATQITSAVLTGRFVLALELLAESSDDGTSPPTTGSSSATALRAASLNGLGRYAEVGRLLGDDPPRGSLRQLRARAAIEVGDDALAEILLDVLEADPFEEAGRLRLLGDLHVRRGRLREGEHLVRTARATYAGSGVAAAQVDAAMCTLLLAEVRLRSGRPAEALPLVRSALEGLAVRPDNAPAFAEAHALAASVLAVLGDGRMAGHHLDAARQHASRCQSPPLDAGVTRSAVLVALTLGDHEAGRRLLHEGISAHEQLGAQPVVAELRSTLAELDR